MNVLILGGTKFLGPHLVSALHVRGHRVTIFHRGRTDPMPPAHVESIIGDRAVDIGMVAGRRWDRVIDTSGYIPRIVRASANALADATDHYTFVSSISAYADPLGGALDEGEPLATIADPAIEEITGETYGALKALCEREVTTAMPDRSLIVRPGLIVGPLDPTDRFTYWPHRFAQGGDVLVPDTPERGISFIDVRDLAEWIVRAMDQRLAGAFNASGDPSITTMGDLTNACMAAAHNDARPIWVPEDYLLRNDVSPWSELPLWLPKGEDSIALASSAKAYAAGLRRRPISETVADTLDWTTKSGLDRHLKAGLTRERERELLAGLP